MLVEFILFFVIFMLLYFCFNESQRHLMPPGPWEKPYFGNRMVNYEYQIEKLQKKYGDIFMTKFGAKRFVYLTDFKTCKSVMSRAEFANRPNLKVFATRKQEVETGEFLGVFVSNGSVWLHNRRFLLRHLRDLGMGKSYLEMAILEEAKHLVENFSSLTDGKPQAVPFSLNLAILNVIWQMMASYRYSLEDVEIQKFVASFHKFQSRVTYAALIDFFPVIAKIVPRSILNKVFNLNSLMQSVEQFYHILRPLIEEHKKTLDVDHPIDLMDEYLAEMINKTSDDYSHFSEEDLLKNCYDIFIAGHDTISNMMYWIIQYLGKYQDIQTKLQEEIDKYVPRDQLPGFEHREKLTYIDAVVSEVSRHCSLTSFGLIRAAAVDTTIEGYFIPKDTILISVASFTQFDPRYWKDPKEFNPSRFIGKNGEFLPPDEGYQPFGLGRRQCLGEILAKMELYTFVGALFQNYRFSPPPGETISITPIKIPHRNKPNKLQKYIFTRRK